jgi:uncharacterized membrane protein YcaP (DUF421 family)
MDDKIWTDMFAMSLPWLEKILRPVIIYMFLVVGLRVAGKRELAQLNPFDLVVLLTLSNTVQNAIIGDDTTVTGGILGAISLLATNYLVIRVIYGHKKAEEVFEGNADALIIQGKVNKERLKNELITEDELLTAAQKQGIASLADVETAVLEPSGTIVFVNKTPPPDVVRHQELLDRLAELTREVAALRSQPASPQAVAGGA